MKSFSERNPVIIGAIGFGLSAAVTLIAFQPPQSFFLDSTRNWSAYFAEAGGLMTGAPVQVAGLEVGKVTSVELDGPRVLVNFNIDRSINLGDRTEATIKTRSLLGAKILAVTPRGTRQLAGAIPLGRTTSPYQLPEVLGELTNTISGLDTNQISESLSTLAQTFSETPPSLREAVSGAARFADTINRRDAQLRNLLANANQASTELAQRNQQVVGIITNTNTLLSELRTQSGALDQLSTNISSLSRQLSGFVADNREQLKPALDKFNGVLTILDNRKQRIQQSIKLLNSFAMSLGESASSGPFFNAYIANLLPGTFMQPFVDAAFSDLGLDPNVLLPSERADPEVGQPGTPALPVPYPRTGQGGEPHLNLPDAITGNPGDQGCGSPELPLPGPTGCYPYREPLPAPPPGGAPPGPPASATGAEGTGPLPANTEGAP